MRVHIPKGFDPYFYYSRYGDSALRGVTKEDVTCGYCEYITSTWSRCPRRAFQDHVRRQHRREYLGNLPFTIREEPDLIFTATERTDHVPS